VKLRLENEYPRLVKKNQVFFEIISPIVIAITLVVISIQANKIALHQAELIKSEQIPVLHFNINRFGQSPKQT